MAEDDIRDVSHIPDDMNSYFENISQQIKNVKRDLRETIRIVNDEVCGCKAEINNINNNKDLLIVSLMEQVEFLKAQLNTVQTDFQQREASMLKIIEFLNSQNTREKNYFACAPAEDNFIPKCPLKVKLPACIKSNKCYNILLSTDDSDEDDEEECEADGRTERKLSISRTTDKIRNIATRKKCLRQSKEKIEKRKITEPGKSPLRKLIETKSSRTEKKKSVLIMEDSMSKDVEGYVASERYDDDLRSIAEYNIEEMAQLCRVLCARKERKSSLQEMRIT